VVDQVKETAGPAAAGLPQGRWRRRAARAAAAGAWVYLAVGLALWALLRAADLWWPATLLMFAPRWLLALPAALLLPAVLLLRRRALVPLLFALPLVFGPVTGFGIPWGRLRPEAPGGTRLRVLTCNMHYRPLDPAPLDHLLAETQPDVVALQEWTPAAPSEVLAAGEWHVHEGRRLFLASRYPIRSATDLTLHLEGEWGPVMRYELETPAGLVTFFHLHLASPREGLQEVVGRSAAAPAGIRAGSELRWRQSEVLAREAAEVSGPVLLAGDFNTPPESALFRQLWGDYADAHGSAGWGWGYTFLGGRTAVRIDHVLAGPGWRCRRCWVGPDLGSPHRPVLADLTWP
jgi:endonuclease/exonuclease/phosphatase (EEP) superfamily protein YafD